MSPGAAAYDWRTGLEEGDPQLAVLLAELAREKADGSLVLALPCLDITIADAEAQAARENRTTSSPERPPTPDAAPIGQHRTALSGNWALASAAASH